MKVNIITVQLKDYPYPQKYWQVIQNSIISTRLTILYLHKSHRIITQLPMYKPKICRVIFDQKRQL